MVNTCASENDLFPDHGRPTLWASYLKTWNSLLMRRLFSTRRTEAHATGPGSETAALASSLPSRLAAALAGSAAAPPPVHVSSSILLFRLFRPNTPKKVFSWDCQQFSRSSKTPNFAHMFIINISAILVKQFFSKSFPVLILYGFSRVAFHHWTFRNGRPWAALVKVLRPVTPDMDNRSKLN